MGFCQLTQNWKLCNALNGALCNRKKREVCVTGGLRHPILLKWKSENSVNTFFTCIFALTATSSGVTLFVDGAKNVNKVGGWITNSSYTIWIITTKSYNRNASKTKAVFTLCMRESNSHLPGRTQILSFPVHTNIQRIESLSSSCKVWHQYKTRSITIMIILSNKICLSW